VPLNTPYGKGLSFSLPKVRILIVLTYVAAFWAILNNGQVLVILPSYQKRAFTTRDYSLKIKKKIEKKNLQVMVINAFKSKKTGSDILFY
jgi:hypothetical protein